MTFEDPFHPKQFYDSVISSRQDISYLLILSEVESKTSFLPLNSSCLRATLAGTSAGGLSDQCFLGWLHVQQHLFARSRGGDLCGTWSVNLLEVEDF